MQPATPILMESSNLLPPELEMVTQRYDTVLLHVDMPEINVNRSATGMKRLDSWSATPRLRQQWLQLSTPVLEDLVNDKIIAGKQSSHPSHDLLESSKGLHGVNETSSRSLTKTWSLSNCFNGTPGLLIAVTLNLFLSTSFGSAFFPSEWDFPIGVPRAIGVQMFLFSTLICQITLTMLSEFPSAMGMMMVENIPFMHTICMIAVERQGQSADTFATVFVAFSISSVVVGIFFYLLGAFRLGNTVYFFPKHVIVGCIGGIGIFILTTGFEVATNVPWRWDLPALRLYSASKVLPLWAVALMLELFLRLVLAITNASLLPPFYFVSIPPLFYIALLLLGKSVFALKYCRL